MLKATTARRLARTLRDLLLGLALFLTISAANAAEHGRPLSSLFAAIPEVGDTTAAPAVRGWGEIEIRDGVSITVKGPERRTALAILAAVFSIMVALNLWFYRHLRRVYASPRHGAWRRG